VPRTQIDALKYAASEACDAALRRGLDDYDIFMAIANDIGYDATGRETKVNELVEIGVALRDFVTQVEKSI
jgi:type I restriction enzyme M protein